MASLLESNLANLRETRVWRSIFRGGWGDTNLHRALAIQHNVFLHLSSVKVRKRALSWQVTWYLGTLSLGTFAILVLTGIPLMLYYHPSVPQAYTDMNDLRFVVSAGLFLRNLHRWSVGSNLISAVPLAGPRIRFLMLGGNGVNANALLRFYVLHCVILPLAAAVFVAVHFWRIRKDGGLYLGEKRDRHSSLSSEGPNHG